jgi:DNA-binding NtrC family response regulator
LLDDLALMPTAAQAALLRVLESRRFRPLGGLRDEIAACRILFATTEEPRELVTEGRILPDLASRLGEFIVAVPALRDRKEDIVPLAEAAARQFLHEHGIRADIRFSEDAIALLQAFDWPTNVRELRAVAERAVVHAGAVNGLVTVRAAHLPERIRLFDGSGAATPKLTLELVEYAIRQSRGNRSEAARRLGVHRNTIAKYCQSSL